MTINKETNSAYKILMELFDNDEAVEKMLNIADYRRKHNLAEKDFIIFDFDVLDVLSEQDKKNVIRKPREMSDVTKRKNAEKAHAKILAKYGY